MMCVCVWRVREGGRNEGTGNREECVCVCVEEEGSGVNAEE